MSKRTRISRDESFILLIMVMIAAAFLGACTSTQKKAEQQPAPFTVDESPTAGQVAPLDGPVPTLYTIKPGDCLWNISKKAYSDPYLWPLIFNQNVHRIADPDLLNIGQEIGIPREYSETLAHYARGFAFKMPVYQPHVKPNHRKYHPNVEE